MHLTRSFGVLRKRPFGIPGRGEARPGIGRAPYETSRGCHDHGTGPRVVTALLEPVEVEAVRAALDDSGMRYVAVTLTLAHPPGPGPAVYSFRADESRGERAGHSLPKVRMEVMVAHGDTADIVRAMTKAAGLDTLVRVS